jgi:hypothetical protein
MLMIAVVWQMALQLTGQACCARRPLRPGLVEHVQCFVHRHLCVGSEMTQHDSEAGDLCSTACTHFHTCGCKFLLTILKIVVSGVQGKARALGLADLQLGTSSLALWHTDHGVQEASDGAISLLQSIQADDGDGMLRCGPRPSWRTPFVSGSVHFQPPLHTAPYARCSAASDVIRCLKHRCGRSAVLRHRWRLAQLCSCRQRVRRCSPETVLVPMR